MPISKPIKKVEVERRRYNLSATDSDKVIIPGRTKVIRKSIGLSYPRYLIASNPGCLALTS